MRQGVDLLNAFRRGDTLTEDEVLKLSTDMQHVEGYLSLYGDVFALAANYASRVASECNKIRFARRNCGGDA